MNGFLRVLNAALMVLTAFLALTAFAGGIGIVAGFAAPPIDQLQGSVFNSYLLPGLSLFVLVGGSALLALVLLIRRSEFATVFAIVSGIVIMVFEFVEVLVIGSPPGVALTLQLLYFFLGTAITIVACVFWFVRVQAVQR